MLLKRGGVHFQCPFCPFKSQILQWSLWLPKFCSDNDNNFKFPFLFFHLLCISYPPSPQNLNLQVGLAPYFWSLKKSNPRWLLIHDPWHFFLNFLIRLKLWMLFPVAIILKAFFICWFWYRFLFYMAWWMLIPN